MTDEEELGEGNSLGWYIGYRIASPILLAVELWMQVRFAWSEWRAKR